MKKNIIISSFIALTLCLGGIDQSINTNITNTVSAKVIKNKTKYKNGKTKYYRYRKTSGKKLTKQVRKYYYSNGKIKKQISETSYKTYKKKRFARKITTTYYNKKCKPTKRVYLIKHNNNKKKTEYVYKYTKKYKKYNYSKTNYNTKGKQTSRAYWKNGKWSYPTKKVSVKKPKSTTTSQNAYFNKKEATAIINKLNVDRRKAGLNTLKVNAKLTKAAEIRAKELEKLGDKWKGHLRPNGDPAKTVGVDPGVDFGYNVGENIYSGGGTQGSSRIYSLWWTSTEGHKERMMRENNVEVGAAVYVNKGFTYSVIVWSYE